MALRTLELPAGYDQDSQSTCALFGSQLNDQTKRLKEAVAELSVAELEWQQHPGMNTIGMLLAHIAVAEIYWIAVASDGLDFRKDGDELLLKIIGIRGEDDGMPLPEDGTHPAALHGKTPDDYSAMLDNALKYTHEKLKSWSDADLPQTYSRGSNEISKAWTLYHIVDHTSIHIGQIQLLKHLMKHAEVSA